MSAESFASLSEQVAGRIILRVQDGTWTDRIPGCKTLAHEFGVNHKTCESALKLLEARGVLVSLGRGRTRKVAASFNAKPKKLRVMLLLYEKKDANDPIVVEVLYRLRDSGHDAIYAERTLLGLQMDVKRVSGYVEKTKADAWIVLAGSAEILEWFAQSPFPAFALFGRLDRNIPIACVGLSKLDAARELTERLLSLGHRRIVFITSEQRRKPAPGLLERSFLQRLEDEGIATGAYNLPDWGKRPGDLQQAMKSLCQVTPPTAVIADEPALFLAIMQQLSRLGYNAPEQVSIACLDQDSVFDFTCPAITHLQWNPDSIIKRITKWIQQTSSGRDDRHKNIVKAKLLVGDTIGPAPKGDLSS